MDDLARCFALAVTLALSGCAVGAELLEPNAPRDASVRRDAGRDSSVISPVDSGPTSAECAASDRDRDSFGDHASCVARDCDEANPAIHPGAQEACNGRDDDCDGTIDEELGEGACGVGACRRTVGYCVDGGLAACVAGAPTPERCNGVDDDCDGMTDEEIADGATCGAGACRRTAQCVAGVMQMCVAGAPTAERCNGLDDDCDGDVDEGFRVAVVNSTYTALAGQHDGCTQATRIGGACNAAIHRLCNARGCTQSGFGPLENSGDTAVVACVASSGVRSVPYATLSMHHPGCTSAVRIGPECNAAIHRYCASMAGFSTGFGPAEQGADTATVTCLRAGSAEVVNSTYTALAGQHAGCTQATRIGSDCNAAIHRFCAGRGFVTGFGPLENSGDTAVVACVRP
jgi:hypothetical protein